MMALPPGCTVAYPISITVGMLSEDMLAWYELVGGEVLHKRTNTYYRTSNAEIIVTMVRYSSAKWCHRYQDGTSNIRLNFNGEDAYIASVFLIKFSDDVICHNFREGEMK